MGSREDHYANMLKTYSNCTVVLENLEITYMEEHRDLSFLRVKSIFYKFCFYAKCPAPCNIFKLSGQSVLTDDKACLWCCGLSCALKPAVDKVVNSGCRCRERPHRLTCTLTHAHGANAAVLRGLISYREREYNDGNTIECHLFGGFFKMNNGVLT